MKKTPATIKKCLRRLNQTNHFCDVAKPMAHKHRQHQQTSAASGRCHRQIPYLSSRAYCDVAKTNAAPTEEPSYHVAKPIALQGTANTSRPPPYRAAVTDKYPTSVVALIATSQKPTQPLPKNRLSTSQNPSPVRHSQHQQTSAVSGRCHGQTL